MLASEAIAIILETTKRPEKEAKALEGINRAISRFSSLANWKKDLVEDEISIDSTLLGDTIDISVQFPQFKKFKYIKPRGERYCLSLEEPERLITPRGFLQPNKFYIAGSNLTYVLSKVNSILDVGVYNFPTQVVMGMAAAEEHWMLTLMPYALIDFSCAVIFQSIGDDKSMQYHFGTAQEWFNIAKGDFEDQAIPMAK